MTALALFGGTFDPPHVGHFVAARDVVEALDLDALRFVPARLPPHKRDRTPTPGRLRLEMLRETLEEGGAAGAGVRGGAPGGAEARMSASDVELHREGPSFTVDTLRQLRRRRPEAELRFVLGVDQLAGLHSWKEPEEVARLARLVVITRDGEGAGDVDPGVDVPFELVPVTRIDVSSTDVRRRVRSGRSIRWLVPDPVRRIIEREGLYREG